MAVKPDTDRPAVAIDVEKMHRVTNNAAELHRRTLRAAEKWQALAELAGQLTGCKSGDPAGQILADREL